MAAEGVLRLRRVGLVVGSLAEMTDFYVESFGFEVVSGPEHGNVVTLRLGSDELVLKVCDPPGRAYPPRVTGADLRFQHFAIVVSDMAEAYGVLRRGGRTIPISTDGPELLPANTGGVTAFKFRDPEGHPLELSMLPPGVGAARWRDPVAVGNCLGVDHSAISVASLAASVAFYEALGLTVSGRSLNRGPEQDRLDGLASSGVDIVALETPDPASPHIELLAYPHPVRSPAPTAPNDLAATRLEFQVASLPAMVERLRACGASFVSPGLIADPDGHLLVFSEG